MYRFMSTVQTTMCVFFTISCQTSPSMRHHACSWCIQGLILSSFSLLLFFFYLDVSAFFRLGFRLSPSRSGDFPAITEGNTVQRNSARSLYDMKIVEQSAENEVVPLRTCKQSGQFVLAAQMSVTRLTEVFHAFKKPVKT